MSEPVPVQGLQAPEAPEEQAEARSPNEMRGFANGDAAGPGAEARAQPSGSPELNAALEAWRRRLSGAGVACRAMALHSADAAWTSDFHEGGTALQARWRELSGRVQKGETVALGKVDGAAGAGLLVAAAVHLPEARATVDDLPAAMPMGVAGVLLAPPHVEHAVQAVLLSLGWLQLALASASLVHNQRCARLLELLAHVGSQTSARAAAQEWVNRTAAWVRAEAPDLDAGFTLFEVRGERPRWWVGADTAWAERAATAVHEAAEVAMRAMVEMQEVDQWPWWAMPLFAEGEPVAVLVMRRNASTAGVQVLPAEALAVLRASASLGLPLLRHWRDAQRSLPLHGVEAARSGWRKLSGPGHWTWKVGASVSVLVLAVLLLWPVADRVTAHTVIEGRARQVVTAPFDGFIAQVLVRPGEMVSRGQSLALLDDRELRLEQARYRSESNQAAGKVRQAMAERDAPALAAAQADVLQADAQLALVESKLSRVTLAAPMDGLLVTGDWAQQIGGPVEAGKEMFELAATGGYRVVLHVPDRDIARVKPGQPGLLRLTGQPQTSYDFEVSRVTATARVEQGVNGFRVEAEWRGAVPTLSPGMQGVGKVEVGHTSLLAAWTRSSVDWLRLKWWSWW